MKLLKTIVSSSNYCFTRGFMKSRKFLGISRNHWKWSKHLHDLTDDAKTCFNQAV